MPDYTYAPGQEWALATDYIGCTHYYRVIVDSVTPSGRACVGANRYSPNGNLIGKLSRYNARPYLTPITDEIRAEWARLSALGKARAYYSLIERATTEELLAVVAIMDGVRNREVETGGK